MLILSVETSCDETACAVLKDSDKILSHVISSSLDRHRAYGGVVPEIAARHCLEAIDIVYEDALKKARVKPSALGLIAFTQGPGLIGSIFVGASFAKALAFALDCPLIAVNHIEAHLEANFIGQHKPSSFIGLIVSGGHTSLVKYQKARYLVLGQTVDDAIGEAYDKVAKLLDLGYPGGPVIDRLASRGNPKTFSFTKPKQNGRFNFSFSGIKTAAYHLQKRERERLRDQETLQNFCASFQETVMRWVTDKTLLACRTEGIRCVVVGGGVSANSRLRALLTEEASLRGIKVLLPPPELTTDNAAMVARLGYSLFCKGIRSDFRVSADPSLKIGNSLTYPSPAGQRGR